MIGVSGFTFWKRPEVHSARALLVLCAAICANAISGSVPDGPSVQFNPLAFATTSFFSYAIFGTLLAPSLLAFTLYFPQPKKIIHHQPIIGLFPYALGLIIGAALLLGDTPEIGWNATMLMMIGSIASLMHSGFTQRDAVSRIQMRVTVGGFVIGLGLALTTFPVAFGLIKNVYLAELMGAGVSVGFTVMGISLAMAVLRYRLYDIDIIIRRTLVYSTLSAFLTLIFFGSVVLLQSISTRVVGRESPVAIVVSTLVIAALFTPFRARIQKIIDQRFYRTRYDARFILGAFSQSVRDEVDVDRLAQMLLDTVKETMQPERAFLWLREK